MPDFPLTVEDTYGGPVTFDIGHGGMLKIHVLSSPVVLDTSADREAFAKALAAACWEADRVEATT